MFEVFKALIKQEGPDYILDTESVGFGRLQAVSCSYAKDGRYYIATTFYTDTWISKSPLGPLSGEVSSAKFLGDVAIIREFSNFQACTSARLLTQQDLRDYMARIDRGIDKYLKNLIPSTEGDTFKYRLNLEPVPCVLVTVVHGAELVGTFAIFPEGSVIPVMACNSRIYEYVRHASSMGMGSTFNQSISLPAPSGRVDVHRMNLGGD